MTRLHFLAAAAAVASAGPAVAQHRGGGGHPGGGARVGGVSHVGGYGGGAYRGGYGGGYPSSGTRGGSFTSFGLSLGGGYPYGGYGGYGSSLGLGYSRYGYGSGFGIGLSVPLSGGYYGGGYRGGYGGGGYGYAAPVVVSPPVVSGYPTVVQSGPVVSAPVVVDNAVPPAFVGQPAPVPGVPAPFGPGVETGLRITDVGPGTAQAAGLKKGDVVLSVDGRRTQTFADVRAVLGVSTRPVTVEYIDAATGEVQKKTVPVDAGKIGVMVVEAPVPRT